MRRIVLHPTQPLDMQYLGPQVRLMLAASIGSVVPGDLVNTLSYGHWQVNAVNLVRATETTAIGVIADLIEDMAAEHSNDQ